MAKPDPDTEERRRRFKDYCKRQGWGGSPGERWQVGAIASKCGKPVTKISNLLTGSGSFGASIARELEIAFSLPKFHFDGGGWPFEEVDFSRWEALTERQKGRVESVMRKEIEAIEADGQANARAA
jgi:hypothetical protein